MAKVLHLKSDPHERYIAYVYRYFWNDSLAVTELIKHRIANEVQLTVFPYACVWTVQRTAD